MMRVLRWMQPRRPRAAARSLSTLCAVAAGVAVAAAPLQREETSGLEVAVAGALLALIFLLSVRSRGFDETHRLAWALGPLLAVPALVAIDLLTHDASLSAQIFFLFPALYGASQLPRAGAAVMTAASVVGELVVVLTQLPLREAIVDASYVTATIVATSVLLASASERHARLVARLKQMAAVDPLTGLATRRVLDEAAGSAMSGAHSDAGTALLILDVDHFKRINDHHGHPAGDQVLVQLARVLTGLSRERDVVCRLGGDEIAVLLPGCGAATALDRAEEILTATRARDFRIADDHDTTVDVSVSIGCAHMPTQATNLHSLYSAADAALYEAKQNGRGRVATVGTLALSR